MGRPHVVVLTGAGISAESGISTFRDVDGLWQGHDVTKVASPEGWASDRSLVLEFYNQRRKQALAAKPNAGHQALAELESEFEVSIVTQNVDSLHEQAGSTRVLHLHGELHKSRSTADPSLVYDIEGWELAEGDLCEKGSQLRPHIVWFGEEVPAMEEAAAIAASADYFFVVGTSLVVYPAAGLVHAIPPDTVIFAVDPNLPEINSSVPVHAYEEPASSGVPRAIRTLQEIEANRRST